MRRALIKKRNTMICPICAGARGVPTVLSVILTTFFTAGAAMAQETPPPEGGVSLDLDVVAKQLDIARSNIQPSLGATVYDFSRQVIETQPQGDNQPLNRLLLQAPGVTQDSFGQLHVRDEHANTQFRINGVQLPEGINVFGQALQTRLANSVALITGSLPAQYGLRTSGIIDIQTKTGTLNPGGSGTLYGGSQGTFQPSAEWGGRVGQIDYYFTGEYLRNNEGIENPAPTFNAIHDRSEQPKGFAYVSGIIDPTSRLTAILGASRSQFQIPQVAGQTPSLGLTVNGISDFASVALNENQRQINNFGILTGKNTSARSISRSPGSPDTAAPNSPPETPRANFCSTASLRPRTDRAGQAACKATAAGGLRPTTRFAAAFTSNGSARRSAPPQMFCRSTRTAFKRATSRSRSSIRAARLAGSTAIICRTNGK